jgi:hypothetical protein
MAAHTVIQLRVATNPKIAKKSKLPIHEGVWLSACMQIAPVSFPRFGLRLASQCN